jgi:hypothetical protein
VQDIQVCVNLRLLVAEKEEINRVLIKSAYLVDREKLDLSIHELALTS